MIRKKKIKLQNIKENIGQNDNFTSKKKKKKIKNKQINKNGIF